MQKSTAVRTAAALWKQRKELRRRIRLMYKRNCFPLSYVYIILHMQQHRKFLPNKKAASNLAAFVYYKLKSSPVFPVSVSSVPASGIPNAAAITSPRLTFPFGFTGFFASSFTSYFMLAGFAKKFLDAPFTRVSKISFASSSSLLLGRYLKLRIFANASFISCSMSTATRRADTRQAPTL